MDIREDRAAVLDDVDPHGPHPVRRALIALLLGVGLGLVAALLQPRPSSGRTEG